MFQEIIIHDFTRSLLQRKDSRRYTGPYYWKPSKPKGGRGFYQSNEGGLSVDRAGSTFDLRLSLASEHVGYRLAAIRGYYIDSHYIDTLTPIIAILPRGRGYLPGWTMGQGMLAAIDRDICKDPETAAIEAYRLAESEAESMFEASLLDMEELEEAES